MYLICTTEHAKEFSRGDTFSWGVNKWGQMFSNRQILALQTLVECIDNRLINASEGSYEQALLTYCGILIDRFAQVGNSFGRLNNKGENFESPFARQAISMMFDYPEISPFSEKAGSPINQLNWILRYINAESQGFQSFVINASSGDREQFEAKSLDAVITDPPYYDAIAYADLSDFFYLWMNRTISSAFPLTFTTPQTPKSEECTAL